MSFFFQYSPYLLLLCAAVAAAAVIWGYRHTIPPLPPGRKVLLGSLRFASFFLICFLLFQPIARRTATHVERPVLAVLIDDSESLALATESADSAASSRARAVEAVLGDLKLPANADLRGFRFSAGASALSEAQGSWLDSLESEGQRTDIAGALAGVRDELGDAHLAGIVLISDGRYNTGSNPLYVAERFPVPIHTVTVGDTTARRDVLIGRVNANRVAYVGAEQPVEVDVQADGFPGSRVSVWLNAGAQRLASVTVDVTAEMAQIPVHLSYVPEEAGLHTITVSVTELDGELTYENNRSTLPVRVLEQKRQILLLAGAADPDVAAVRQILSSDADMEVTVRVQKDASSYYEGPLPPSLGTFDALVLVGYPGRTADREVISRVREAVEGGLPLLFVMSGSVDLTVASAELGDVLPATTEGNRSGWMEALPELTSEGLQHPVLAVPDAAASDWKRLPPLRISESRWEPTPDARTLATIEVRGVDLDDPLIVIRSRGGTRSAAVLGAGTWRWKNVPTDLADMGHLWPQTLSNTLRWITAARDQRPVRVRPVREIFAGQEAVEFVGEVYDESLRPVPDAGVELNVTAEDGREYPFRMESIGNGRYELDAASLPEGIYRYEAAAMRGALQLGTDSGSFTVGDLTLEHRDTRADPVLMRQIASRSGGRSFDASEAATLGAALQDDASIEPRTASLVTESNLRRRPIFLFMIVLFLTAEWVLRKRSGLV